MAMRRPARSRPQSLRAIIGGLIDPTRTWYRGVFMRSRLEADFARWLDSLRIPWTYEPTIFGPKGAGYLPDFRIAQGVEETYVEVKPTLEQAEAARARMEVIWDSRPDALLLVVSAQDCRFFAAANGEPWTTWVDLWKHA